MTVLIAALNEEAVIGKKVCDVLAQQYSGDLEVLVVADGSTDGTVERAREAGARVIHEPVACGKSAAVNRGMAVASGAVVCLTDANCSMVPGCLDALGAAFDDPRIGVVSGAKSVVGPGAHGRGESLYWRLESVVKRGESRFGAVMGAPGELCGVRRTAFRPIPDGILNDDYHLTCDALIRGWWVGYVAAAAALEVVSASVSDELERRSRIAAGTWQTSLAHLGLADPRRGVVALAFGSHRLLRNLVAPLLIPVLFVSSLVAVLSGRRWAVPLLAVQGAGYAASSFGLVTGDRRAAVPAQFLLTNVAAIRGLARFVSGRQSPVWKRAARGPWVDASTGYTQE